MLQCCSCLYHIVTSNWNNILLLCLPLKSFQWSFAIDWAHLIHDKHPFILINLLIASQLICLPKFLINSYMHSSLMSLYLRIKLQPLLMLIDLLIIRSINLLSSDIDIHPPKFTHMQVTYGILNAAMTIYCTSSPPLLNTHSQFHEVDLLLTAKAIINYTTCFPCVEHLRDFFFSHHYDSCSFIYSARM